MPMDQSITAEFPILEGDEQKIRRRLLKMRGKLERVFKDLVTVSSVIIFCNRALHEQNSECDADVATLLRRYVDSPLATQLQRLHKVITKLGGVTEFSEPYNEESDDAIILAF